MAYERRDMEGVLFKNEDRKTDKHPNAQGSAIIDGVEYWVSAWTKEGSKGKFQSLAFKRKSEAVREVREQQARQPVNRSGYAAHEPAYDDEIPFAPEWRV